MNIRLLKREIANLIMLIKIAKTHGWKLFFWSFADGISRRLGMNSVYKKTHYYRHEACKEYLKKKYSYVVEKYKSVDATIIDKVGNDSTIWRYWHQGVEQVPYPVDITLKSINGRVGNHPVVILNKDTYKNYIEVPQYIIDKCEKGQMNIAVFSDYLRLALLKQYGGIWLDSTFFVNQEFPKDINDVEFYTINQGNKRDWVVTRDRWSVGLLACGPQNPLISFCEEFLREYWKNEVTPVAYLMTDCIIGIAYDEIPVFREMINRVPVNNTHCFDFLSEFRDKAYDKDAQKLMNEDTYLYQLSYKFSWNLKGPSGELTNFGGLVENGG